MGKVVKKEVAEEEVAIMEKGAKMMEDRHHNSSSLAAHQWQLLCKLRRRDFYDLFVGRKAMDDEVEG